MVRPRATEKEQALMRAAVELFLEKGVRGATVKEIAARAGVATGTFYVYYGDKVAMIRAVAYAFADQHTAMAQTVLESHHVPADKLSRYLLGLYDLWQPFGGNDRGPLELAEAVIRHANETLGIAQKRFLLTIEVILHEAMVSGAAVKDPATEARWIAYATSAFFPLAGTPTERPFADALNRAELEGLIAWLARPFDRSE
ncbi:MAG: TetR/AcrR family transcriptional regulator [Opitutales bacterium]|nr:TetR/AcrR family transcriptional regulator [Opitutales bacterium]NRA26694.1 TetR/AcrR family transcriptional regulator [Opitutales bacterium]